MADYRSAYFGLTGKYPTDVQEDEAEDYSQRLASSPYQRLGALAGWISGANIAAGAPGPRFGLLRPPSNLTMPQMLRNWLTRPVLPAGLRPPSGPRTEVPAELAQEIGAGFGQLRRGATPQKSARALEGRNPAGRGDVPSWDVSPSTEAPGGRAYAGAPPEGSRASGRFVIDEPTNIPAGGTPFRKMLTKGAYSNVSDELMGFSKRPPTLNYQPKGYHEQNYPHSQAVRVQYPGNVFEDEIKGMHLQHALARALRNWPGAAIEVLGP